jgi:ribosomal 50S subunit-associated protein YjgA (DUF615 family)
MYEKVSEVANENVLLIIGEALNVIVVTNGDQAVHEMMDDHDAEDHQCRSLSL